MRRVAPQHRDRIVTTDYCDVTSPYVLVQLWFRPTSGRLACQSTFCTESCPSEAAKEYRDISKILTFSSTMGYATIHRYRKRLHRYVEASLLGTTKCKSEWRCCVGCYGRIDVYNSSATRPMLKECVQSATGCNASSFSDNKKGCHPNHGYNFVNSWRICKLLSLLKEQ